MPKIKRPTFVLNNTWKWWTIHQNKFIDNWCNLLAIESSDKKIRKSYSNSWVQSFERWALSKALDNKEINTDIIVIATLPNFVEQAVLSYLTASNKWRTIFVEKPIAISKQATQLIMTKAKTFNIQIIMWGQTIFSESWKKLQFWNHIHIERRSLYKKWVEKYWSAILNILPHCVIEIREILKQEEISLDDVEITKVIKHNRSKLSHLVKIRDYHDSIYVEARAWNDTEIILDASQWIDKKHSKSAINQTGIKNWQHTQKFWENTTIKIYTSNSNIEENSLLINEDTVGIQAKEITTAISNQQKLKTIDLQTEHQRIMDIMLFLFRVNEFNN